MKAAGVLSHVRELIGGRDTTDSDLLVRFAQERDEAAFAELLYRHGPMVLGVCRRVLGNHHAAEDAFQATFLLLARRAPRLGRPVSLAGWLHTVARRTARDAVRRARCRHKRELAHAPPNARGDDMTWREIRQQLDTEIARLPAVYRPPLILCYLENVSQPEAARSAARGPPGTSRTRAGEASPAVGTFRPSPGGRGAAGGIDRRFRRVARGSAGDGSRRDRRPPDLAAGRHPGRGARPKFADQGRCLDDDPDASGRRRDRGRSSKREARTTAGRHEWRETPG